MGDCTCPYCGKSFDPTNAPKRSMYTAGDLMKKFGMTRAVFDRICRQWGRELPEPQMVGKLRMWDAASLPLFESVVDRDTRNHAY